MLGLTEPWDQIVRGAILIALTMGWIIMLVRVVGLRSFSKMTSFDFVATVATGSMLAAGATVNGWAAFWQVIAALAALFAIQFAIARMRQDSDAFEAVIQNEPLLLMRDGEIIESALEQSRVNRDDLIAKLREANALDFASVRAVVLETTGDISVLHGEHVDERLLDGVRGWKD